MAHIVLLGTTGYVGTAIVRQVSKTGGGTTKTTALVRDHKKNLPASIDQVIGALPEVPSRLMPDDPHVIVHFATKNIDQDSSGFRTVNIDGTRQLMNKLNSATRGVIYGSSLSVYGRNPQNGHDESRLLAPNTHLAKSRVDAERIVLQTSTKHNISAAVLRPRFILGRGDRFTLPGLLSLTRKGRSVGSGEQQFTIIDVDDYANIVLKLAEQMLTASTPFRESLHIGYRRPLSMTDIVACLCRVFDLEQPQKRIPTPKMLPALLRFLPHEGSRALAIKLELVGFSHVVSVEALACRIGEDMVDKDPKVVFADAAETHKEREQKRA